jgi:hypothetical protein
MHMFAARNTRYHMRKWSFFEVSLWCLIWERSKSELPSMRFENVVVIVCRSSWYESVKLFILSSTFWWISWSLFVNDWLVFSNVDCISSIFCLNHESSADCCSLVQVYVYVLFSSSYSYTTSSSERYFQSTFSMSSIFR